MRKVVFIEVLLTLCYQDLLSYPWNNNTREHLFGTVEECKKEDCDNYHVWLHDDSSKCEDPDCKLDDHTLYHVDASIQDEGFRWRNSLNFTIDGENISEWKFNPVVKWDKRIGNFELSTEEYEIDGADKIHRHLSDIACNIKQANPRIVNIATAAITIVTKEEGKYKAYSTSLCDIINGKLAKKVIVALTKGECRLGDSIFSLYNNVVNSYLKTSCNLPIGKYACSEGKICAFLVNQNSNTMTFIQLVNSYYNLFDSSPFANKVKLIILHIHTIIDPCAICIRNLAGISKLLNDKFKDLWPHANIKFLVEISSSKGYPTHPNEIYSNKEKKWKTISPDAQDNFALWCGNYSHTECAGHDGEENTSVNIRSDTLSLAYPIYDWRFSAQFSPYIILSRINSNGREDSAPNSSHEENYSQCNIMLNKVY